MLDRFVVDASVAAKLLFTEALSDAAEAAMRSARSVIAPDLLFIELASIAAKRVRQGTSPPDVAARAMEMVDDLLDESVALGALAKRAFEIASEHGVSAYDGAYLALAEARELRVLTADLRLVRRASEQGLSHLVEPLTI
jgi:predicted nucleic acid-binding protein